MGLGLLVGKGRQMYFLWTFFDESRHEKGHVNFLCLRVEHEVMMKRYHYTVRVYTINRKTSRIYPNIRELALLSPVPVLNRIAFGQPVQRPYYR